MIIGFEAKRVFQNASGLGNYSRNTINLLAKYYPENRYKLFAPKLTNLYLLPDQADVILPLSKLFKFLRSYWRLNVVSKLLKNNHIDIFHGLSHVIPYGIEKTGIPSIVTMHDLIFLRYPEFYKKIDRKIYESVYKSSCKRATKIIAISEQTKSDLIHFLGTAPDKIEVIYQTCNNCFYEKVTEDRKKEVKRKFGLPDQFILTVGTIEKRKNQLAILKAVIAEKLDIPVVILGRPRPKEYLDEIKRFINGSGIQKQVMFIHNSNTSELQAIYQMAQVMVYPSYFEGFGLPVLEAQASGCPVITSNLSSLPEAGGDGAIYVDPSDISAIGKSIRNILYDNILQNGLKAKGYANAGLFSEKMVADRLMKLYNEVIEEQSRNPK
ncbi:MAG: glycosyltransferase family 1 protein [Mariniphaga sp.]